MIFRSSRFWLLLIIMIISFFLRVWGTNFGFPLRLHLDENVHFGVGMAMVEKRSFDPSFVSEWGFIRPSFIYNLFAVLTGSYLFLGKFFGFLRSFSDINPASIFLLGRILIASLGTLSVWLTYKITVKIFDWKVGVLASTFLGFTFLHVVISHYGTSDIPQSLFQLIGFYFIYRIIKEGKLRDYILAGLLIGFAISSNYHAAWNIFNLIVGYFLSFSSIKSFRRTFRQKTFYLFSSLVFVLIGFFLISPFILFNFPRFIQDASSMKNSYRTGQNAILASSFNGISTPIWWTLYLGSSGLSYPYLFLVIGGLASCILRLGLKGSLEPRVCLLLVSYPAIWFLTMATNVVRYDRHAIAVLPMFAILASICFWHLVKYLKINRKLVTILLLLIFLIPTFKIVAFDYLISQKDTRLLAAEWLAKEYSKDQTVFAIGDTIHIGHYLQKEGFSNVMNLFPFDTKEIFQYPGEILLIDSATYHVAKNYKNTEQYKNIWENYQLVKEKGELIKEFSYPLFKAEFFSPAFLEHSSTVNAYHNPTVEVYKIPKLDEYVAEEISFEYRPEEMSHNMQPIEKNGKKFLFKEPEKGELIAGPYKLFPKGEYLLEYFVVSPQCIDKKTTIILRVTVAGQTQDFGQYQFSCQNLGEYNKLKLPFRLEKPTRLELILEAGEGISFLVEKGVVRGKTD